MLCISIIYNTAVIYMCSQSLSLSSSTVLSRYVSSVINKNSRFTSLCRYIPGQRATQTVVGGVLHCLFKLFNLKF